MNEHERYKRRKSRNQARRNRFWVIDKFSGRCAVCEYMLAAVLAVHHIQPVSQDGDGSEDNLIALCPNCHNVVHKIKKYGVFNDAFLARIMNVYGLNATYKLASLAMGVLVWDEVDAVWKISTDDRLANAMALAINKLHGVKHTGRYVFGYKIERLEKEYLKNSPEVDDD